ncbi:MAG: Gfo/Idh/MocA family protein, partial [Armatimonadota bacterium]
RHADVVVQCAPHVPAILVEKPFAASLADADAMVDAVKAAGGTLAINWPLAWYPSHCTAKRLIDEGTIGAPIEVHYYDGNRGPLRHVADKVEIPEDEAQAMRAGSWWYRRDAAGGSLQDYLGYGTTLGTWFLGGRCPVEVTCVVDERPGMDVDEHAIVVARYEAPVGLSKFETRWGTFTDPWTHQPEPRCGFVIVGTRGTIASPDYSATLRVQTVDHPEGREVPVDRLEANRANPIAHFVHHLETGEPLHGPLRPDLCRIGQRIVDAAVRSAREKRTVAVPA